MSQIDKASYELREMEDYAAGVSPVHSLHPLVKTIVTIVYIVCTASFPKYGLSGLVSMVLFPALVFALSGIPVRACVQRLKALIPLLVLMGCFDLFFDRQTAYVIGGIRVTGGAISFAVIFLKGILCLTASFLLAATTPLDKICAALTMMGIPSFMTTLILLTFRYISVMIDEFSAMNTAYLLRAPGQKGIHYTAWGSFIGQLLLRSMDRAGELYESMQLRGFKGDMRYSGCSPFTWRDLLMTLAAVLIILIFRFVNISRLLGSLLV